MSIEWVGADTFARWLRSTPDVTVKDVAAAIYQEAENMMSTAKTRTPVDTGYLRSTGNVKQPKTTGTTTTVQLGFGTDYAIYVHEITSSNHPVGQAKFLESAVLEAIPQLTDRLIAKVQTSMKARI